MSPEQNKDIIRAFYDNLSRGNVNIIDDLLTSDFIEHEQLPTPGQGREAVKQFFNMFSSAFPDARFNVEEMYTDGDTVIARFKVRGTQQGDLHGIVPATGKQINVEGIDILRIADGKLVEHWG